MEAALNQPTFLTQAQALLGKAISEHITQRNAEVKSIINKDRQVAPKRMQLGARLAVNTHNMGGHFVESVKNAWWLMRPQEAGDGLESMDRRIKLDLANVRADGVSFVVRICE